MLIWISDLLVYIIFLFSEEQQFLQGRSPGNAFLQFLSEEVFISSSLMKDNFFGYTTIGGWFIYATLQMHYFLLLLVVSDKTDVILYFVPPQVRWFSPLRAFLKDLSLVFLQFEYDGPRCSPLVIYPDWWFSEIPGCVLWDLPLILENSQPLLLQMFLLLISLFHLLIFQLCIYYTFCDCLTIPGYSIPFSPHHH